MYAYQFERQLPGIILRLFGGKPEQTAVLHKPSANHNSTVFLDTSLGRPKATVAETPRVKFCLHCGSPFPFKANKKFCCGNHRKEHWDAAHPKRKVS